MSDTFHTTTEQIVVFTLDELQYALTLNTVVRVIHAVEIRPLPKAPEIISGIINVQGQVISVIDTRKRFGLKEREVEIDDHMIISDTGKRIVALLADAVNGIRKLEPGQLNPAGETLHFAKYLKGVAKTGDGIILIYDLEQFLSLDEEKILEKALKAKTR